MAFSVDWTGWAATDNRLGCCYDYRDPVTKVFLATITFDFQLEGSLGGLVVHPLLSIQLEPFVIEQELYLALMLEGKDRLSSNFLPVTLTPNANATGASIRFSKRDDVMEIIRVLRLGEDLVLSLRGPSEVLVCLPVPNNRGFSELYDELYLAVSSMNNAREGGRSLLSRLFR